MNPLIFLALCAVAALAVALLVRRAQRPRQAPPSGQSLRLRQDDRHRGDDVGTTASPWVLTDHGRAEPAHHAWDSDGSRHAYHQHHDQSSSDHANYSHHDSGGVSDSGGGSSDGGGGGGGD
jgi:uncharacterized membrane protein YgcG